jgi:CubicO group peptidase (beta-lactamase class C family)
MDSSAEAPHATIQSLIPELDQLAAGVMADWKVPGATLAVVQDGKVALTRAYGVRDVERDLPMTTATQFVILHRDRYGVAAQRRAARLDQTGA